MHSKSKKWQPQLKLSSGHESILRWTFSGVTPVGSRAENMRREGFELSVSPPRVVFKEEGGRRLEPLEEVICEVDDDQMGSVIEVCPACLALPEPVLEDNNLIACGL